MREVAYLSLIFTHFPMGGASLGKLVGQKVILAHFLCEHDENQSYNDVKP